MLDPFSVNPAGPLQRHLLYWYATVCRSSANATKLSALHLAAGASSIDRNPVAGFALIPSFTVATYPAGKFVVSIEGTTTVNQWLLHMGGQGTVASSTHGGFVSVTLLQVAQAVESLITPKLSANLTEWVLTGHSMGGGLAALLYRFYIGPPFGTIQPKAIVDFGSPKVGNGQYASGQTLPRWRVTNEGDPVPLLPPTIAPGLGFPLGRRRAGIELNWQHWGTRLHLWSDFTTTRPPGIPDFGLAAITAQLLLNRIRGEAVADNHLLEEYCFRLRGAIPIKFPAQADDPDYPGIDVIDGVNAEFNAAAGVTWPIVPWENFLAGDPVFSLPYCGYDL